MKYKWFLATGTIVLICLSLIGSIQAQQVPDATFGVIPDSLAKVSPPASAPEAPYVITNKETEVSFQETGGSIQAILEHHVRLKVFDETAAREAATVAIPYYFQNDMEQVSNIRGITHLPSGRREILQEQAIRTINLNARYNLKEFVMPAVEKGAVVEYQYKVRRRYIEELPDFYLAHRVPTSWAKVSITYPRYLRYRPLVEHYGGELQHDIIHTDTSSVPKIFMIPQPEPIVSEQWAAQSIAPVKEAPFITTLNDYRGKIKFLLSEFGIPRQHLETSWAFIVAKIRRDLNPRRQAEQNIWARSLGDSIAQAHSSRAPEVVQDSIYRHLNERVNFSGATAPYSEIGDSTVLSGQPAGQAAINQTLLAMLHGAGLEAAPVLISTRKSGTVNKEFPSFYQFNGQLISSTVGGESYLMDASYPYSQPGLISVKAYNGPGLKIDKSNYQWTAIEPVLSTFDIDVTIDAELLEDGTLRGKVVSQQRGYPAQLLRQQYAEGASREGLLRQALFDGYSQLEIQQVSVRHLKQYSETVEMEARFEIEDYATSFSDGLNFRPMVVGYMRENPFENAQRDLPVTLDAPEQLNVSYSIDVPPGYTLEQGRQNESVELPGARFLERYEFREQEMNYEYDIDIRKKDFSTKVFPQLYNLYQRWTQLSNTSWLIKKS